MSKTAIMIDGGFYRKRAEKLWGPKSPKDRASELITYCQSHLRHKHENRELYRIFYYDCPPMDKKLYHPFLKTQVDFSKTDTYGWMTDFLNELRKKRKTALRLGSLLDTQAHYTIRPEIIKKLCNGSISFSQLTQEDFSLCLDQKGVDMKIGIDIASLSLKKQVDQIILISGDSDFVPASKLARREGVDFILDPLWATIKPDLFEHIDGLMTLCPKPQAASAAAPPLCSLPLNSQ